MDEELQLINHYLLSKDPTFLLKVGAFKDYFITTGHIVDWIENYKASFGNTLPTVDTVRNNFDNFETFQELDAVPYLVGTLKENRLYMEYRPIIERNAGLLSEGNTLQALREIRDASDALLKKYGVASKGYDWVKDAKDRFDRYMETHGASGTIGITTGIRGLDEITGGWLEDDLGLIVGRTNEGKSMVANYFLYSAWLSFVKQKRNDPVILFSTEMNPLSVSYRLDALRSHLSNKAMRRGTLGDPKLYEEYLLELEKKENSLLIMSSEHNGGRQFTTDDIRSIIESEKPGLVLIDQLYDISDGTGERDIRKRIVNVSNQIRKINLDSKTPTLLVAQAGRDAAKDIRKDKNAAPEIHQIQESDNPAQKSTKVISLRFIDEVFRLTVKKNREDVKDTSVFIRANLDKGIWDEISEESLVF